VFTEAIASKGNDSAGVITVIESMYTTVGFDHPVVSGPALISMPMRLMWMRCAPQQNDGRIDGK